MKNPTLEKQVCRKCGRVYATVQVSAVTFQSFGRIERITSEDKCPKCGGLVIWVSEDGRPLSSERQMADLRRKAGWAVFWILVAIGLFFLARLLKH
jgi:predicted RNA-binding Zn-ribbon protein involved in translation (DUF1610 family)